LPTSYLLGCLRDEVRELEKAWLAADYMKIREEAADVANFAMMVADNARGPLVTGQPPLAREIGLESRVEELEAELGLQKVANGDLAGEIVDLETIAKLARQVVKGVDAGMGYAYDYCGLSVSQLSEVRAFFNGYAGSPDINALRQLLDVSHKRQVMLDVPMT
jgi:NTP pyrophosphatase (non-canonical NTP hydrolase)